MNIIVRSSEFGVRSSARRPAYADRQVRGAVPVGCVGTKRGALRSRPEFGRSVCLNRKSFLSPSRVTRKGLFSLSQFNFQLFSGLEAWGSGSGLLW